jgi:DNA-binding NtrC family response regulator
LAILPLSKNFLLHQFSLLAIRPLFGLDSRQSYMGYHLLITDNDMPKVSGVDLVKKLHAARLALPVIMATGTFPVEELNRHPWLPIEATLLKPYSVEELLTTVSNVLRATDGVLEQFASPPNRKSQPLPNRLRL